MRNLESVINNFFHSLTPPIHPSPPIGLPLGFRGVLATILKILQYSGIYYSLHFIYSFPKLRLYISNLHIIPNNDKGCQSSNKTQNQSQILYDWFLVYA